MYNSKLTKEEIITRIVKEKEMYLYNAAVADTATIKAMYESRAKTIETLMLVLEIEKGGC